jgi:hypothetical protein
MDMNKVILAFLVGLSLAVTIAFSPSAESAPLSLQPPTSPISPIPHEPGSSGSKSSGSNAVSSESVWVLQAGGKEFWINTRQVGVGWWDVDGNLHIELNSNGVVKIPLEHAVMISIPGDAAGVPVPPGWRKIMRPENEEWVIVRATG